MVLDAEDRSQYGGGCNREEAFRKIKLLVSKKRYICFDMTAQQFTITNYIELYEI